MLVQPELSGGSNPFKRMKPQAGGEPPPEEQTLPAFAHAGRL
jgi:hypothetical protein